MSLHAAAQHLAAHGRGNDTELVHMTPGEVKSLHDLARAHGGSLTTNPKTGLTEAGFLEAALPVAAGFALGPAGFGLSAGMAGLAGGALGYAMTGSLTKGLMAGLGAYGGAGLGAGLSGIGAATSEAGLTAGAGAVTGLEGEAAKQAFLANPEATMMSAPVSNPTMLDAFGNTPGAKGFDLATSGATVDAAKQQAFTNAYEKAAAEAAKPSFANAWKGITAAAGDPALLKNIGGEEGWAGAAKLGLSALAPAAPDLMKRPGLQPLQNTATPNPVYTYNRGAANPMPAADPYGVEQTYFPDAGYTRVAAKGGEIKGYANGGAPGPVEQMSIANSLGQNTGYPQAAITKGAYATPWQTPISRNMLEGAADTGVNPISGEMNFASGGLSDLGSYSDGGRLLRGPGDGVSDSIPAVIGHKQPARLADGEFVVPARIVSELGNGSTEAGARKLYAMMDRVQKVRSKTVGKDKVAKNTRADKYLPA